MGCGRHLFDVVGVKVHAQGVDEVFIAQQDVYIVRKSINTKQHDLAGVRPRIQDVSHAIFIDFQFEVLSNRTSIQKVVRPICAAKVHLVKGA